MHLREGEKILKVYHHHPTPFIFLVLKVIGSFLPFFFLLFLFKQGLSTKAFAIGQTFVFLLFALVIVYISLIYWLDKLIVTNMRTIFINWKYLTLRDEGEALLDDIQDIETKEKGIFSYFWIFDYGHVKIETASSHTIIEFVNAPDPEGIRHFIYHSKDQ